MLVSRTDPCVAGDILLFIFVLESLHRPWVAKLLIPYIVCFGIAMLAALVSVISKSALIYCLNWPASVLFPAQCR